MLILKWIYPDTSGEQQENQLDHWRVEDDKVDNWIQNHCLGAIEDMNEQYTLR
jgi:hypothetical protein